MANAREIQNRMKSIKDTMKITNAMYMVSSSKLQKARRELKNTEPYFTAIRDSLAKILDVAPEAGNIYFDKRPKKGFHERVAGYLVITADKGLAVSLKIQAVDRERFSRGADAAHGQMTAQDLTGLVVLKTVYHSDSSQTVIDRVFVLFACRASGGKNDETQIV